MTQIDVLTRAGRHSAAAATPGGGAGEATVPALVEAAAGGDRQAWDTLVGRFAPSVWAVARSYQLARTDAAYLTQTIWLRLSDRLQDADPAIGFEAWLSDTARRESLRMLMRRDLPVPARDAALVEQMVAEDGAAANQLAEPAPAVVAPDARVEMLPTGLPARRLFAAIRRPRRPLGEGFDPRPMHAPSALRV